MTKIGEDFPQTREARKAKLQDIRNDSTSIGTVKVPGRGVQKVYKIPLQFLSYNPYNTRFLAQAKTLEIGLGRKLRDDKPEDVEKIEEFIWKEKEDKNASTINSLIKDGQLVPGVVTIDGVVLSGNRRFRLLNEISRNKSKYSSDRTSLDHLEYFEAAIIDEELSQKEIVRYESFYQYGTEDKADYDPIQKYIAADTQKQLGFTNQEIADNFNIMTDGNPRKVEEWLEVYQLMEEYLDYIDEPDIYTALEGKEEAFLQLRSVIKSFNGSRGSASVLWQYDENDIADLKCRFYDFIRIDFPTHNFRLFKKVFQNESKWKEFNSEIEKRTADVDSFQAYRESFENLNESDISKRRSRDFRDENAEAYGKVYSELNAFYAEKEVQETPLNLSNQILQKIAKLSAGLESLSDYPEELVDNIRTIQKEIGHIKQRID